MNYFFGRIGRWLREDDRTWAVRKFREGRRSIETSSEIAQFAFDTALAIYWKMFLAEHGNPISFATLPRSTQMDHYRNWLKVTRSKPADREATLAAQMFCHYLAAIINGDFEFEAEAAQFLDWRARMGWDLANLPDEPKA